jgi:hypothetical protein
MCNFKPRKTVREGPLRCTGCRRLCGPKPRGFGTGGVAHIQFRCSAAAPRARGQVERLERVVQGDCAASYILPLGRGRRATTLTSLDLYYNDLGEGGAGAGRGTARQHQVARPPRESPGRGQRACAGRDTARQHHAHVARPWQDSPGKGRRAGADKRHCASTPRSRRSALTRIAWERRHRQHLVRHGEIKKENRERTRRGGRFAPPRLI